MRSLEEEAVEGTPLKLFRLVSLCINQCFCVDVRPAELVRGDTGICAE